MLKKVIVGLLVATVVVAAGVSIYNASANQMVENQNPTLAAIEVAQTPAAQDESIAAQPDIETAAVPQSAAEPIIPEQGQGAWASAGNGGNGAQGKGRFAAQGTQAAGDSALYAADSISGGSRAQGNGRFADQGIQSADDSALYAADAANGGTRGSQAQRSNGGQRAAGTSGRPSWAGQSQGGQH